jgi:hypothetical protein
LCPEQELNDNLDRRQGLGENKDQEFKEGDWIDKVKEEGEEQRQHICLQNQIQGSQGCWRDEDKYDQSAKTSKELVNVALFFFSDSRKAARSRRHGGWRMREIEETLKPYWVRLCSEQVLLLHVSC